MDEVIIVVAQIPTLFMGRRATVAFCAERPTTPPATWMHSPVPPGQQDDGTVFVVLDAANWN